MTKRVYLSIILIGVSLFGCTEHPQSEQSHLKHTRRIAHHGQQNHFRQQARGEASWYGCAGNHNLCPWGDDNTQGKPTASGIIFDTHKNMCASWYFPLHTRVIIKNVKTHKYATCKVEDRGPNLWTHRIIDVSQAVKNRLGMVGNEQVVVYAPVKSQLTPGAF